MPRAALHARDDRLIAPGNRYEILHGILTHLPALDEARAIVRPRLALLLRAHVTTSYEVASGMLTRTSEVTDIASDASVFPHAVDPHTEGRQLEELVFLIAHAERLDHAGSKAAEFTERGVRTAFAIDVTRQRVLRWSASTTNWQLLTNDGVITDRAFAVPLPIAALLDAAATTPRAEDLLGPR